ncbi:MAG: DUF2262 domain-containing protein [Microbacterium sp.]|uniref:DUF2262 domain-containing protein n=1 Tax=Microbacterium sp. TaxID=51671 RepID=UPI0039E23FD1
MSEKQERARFERTHAGEVIEITVLTGSSTGGAGKAGTEILWTASAEVLGYVDEHGAVTLDGGRLHWLATDEQRGDWVHDLKSHTQYTVRVRRRLPADPADYAGPPRTPLPDFSHVFALEEVIERDVHVPALDERLARHLEPVIVTTDVGTFELQRSLGLFSGAIDWCGHEVSAHLSVDDDAQEGSETCGAALARLECCLADAESTDARWRRYAATNLLEIAREWQADSDAPDDAPLTEEVFVERISLAELSVSTDGSMTPCYDDGGLFWGHVILIEVEPDGGLTDADIAG